MGNFITLFLSLIIESFPFVVLGVFVSVLIALFVSESFIAKIIPKNKFLSNFILSFLGIFLPVCQCGNIPVARRLLLQKLAPSQAMVFLLAAPIVNPITFITTWQAFPQNHDLAIIRLALGVLIANLVGFILQRSKDQNKYLTKEF